MRGEKLYLRNGIWWARVRDRRGRIVRRTTRCRDYQAAVLEYQNLERQAVDPTYATASETRLDEAVGEYVQDLVRREASEATKQIAAQKCGHFIRIWKPDMPLARVDARLVNDYIDQRQKEGVKNFTIKKELGQLRQVLLLARHQGAFHLDLERVMPPFFRGGHTPKKRAPTPAELRAVLEQFPKRRAAHLAFIAATGARLGESLRARRADTDLSTGLVHLRGTKTAGSLRTVPVTPLVRPLLEWAIESAPSRDVLFHAWGKLHRDVTAACVRADVAPFTPNDLRRAFTTWHRDAGVEPQLLAALLGHTTDKLVQTTYGKLKPLALGALIEDRLRGVPAVYQSTGKTGSTQAHPDDETPEKQAPPRRIERPTNGLGNHPQSARSIGTKKGLARALARAIVPPAYVDIPAESAPPWPWSPGRRFEIHGAEVRLVGAAS